MSSSGTVSPRRVAAIGEDGVWNRHYRTGSIVSGVFYGLGLELEKLSPCSKTLCPAIRALRVAVQEQDAGNKYSRGQRLHNSR